MDGDVGGNEGDLCAWDFMYVGNEGNEPKNEY